MHSRVWVVVAGAGDVRIVTPSVDDPGFEIVAEFGAPQNHATEAHEKTEGDHANVFMRSVSAHINREAARGAFDHLLLFAPPSPLAELRSGLAETVQAKVRSAQPIDLTGVALDGLPPLLAPHLGPLG